MKVKRHIPIAAFFALIFGGASLASAASCCAEGMDEGCDLSSCAEQQLLPYLRTQQALAADDFGAAQKAAASAVEGMDGAACCVDEGAPCHAEFQASKKIAAASSIADARAAFKQWSDALMAKVEEHGLNHGVVYKMHCPMAFGNKGAAWLQDSTPVRNPYYGASMLTCGRQVSAIDGGAAPGGHAH